MLPRFKSMQVLFTTAGTTLHIVWQAYPSGLLGTILIQVLQGLLPLGTAWVSIF